VISMDRRLGGPDRSLNAPVRADGEGECQDWLVDESETQENALAEREELANRKELMDRVIKALNQRERRILTERRLKDNPMTLEELARECGVSRERVRQIEARALEKLRKSMLADELTQLIRFPRKHEAPRGAESKASAQRRSREVPLGALVCSQKAFSEGQHGFTIRPQIHRMHLVQTAGDRDAAPGIGYTI
jgi:DNA-binding CsgD family transcriptional regulator